MACYPAPVRVSAPPGFSLNYDKIAYLACNGSLAYHSPSPWGVNGQTPTTGELEQNGCVLLREPLLDGEGHDAALV